MITSSIFGITVALVIAIVIFSLINEFTKITVFGWYLPLDTDYSVDVNEAEFMKYIHDTEILVLRSFNSFAARRPSLLSAWYIENEGLVLRGTKLHRQLEKKRKELLQAKEVEHENI